MGTWALAACSGEAQEGQAPPVAWSVVVDLVETQESYVNCLLPDERLDFVIDNVPEPRLGSFDCHLETASDWWSLYCEREWCLPWFGICIPFSDDIAVEAKMWGDYGKGHLIWRSDAGFHEMPDGSEIYIFCQHYMTAEVAAWR